MVEEMEQFGPWPSDSPEQNLEYIANEVQQPGEKEKHESPQDTRQRAVGGAEEEPLACNRQVENFWPPPETTHLQRIEMIVKMLHQEHKEEEEATPPERRSHAAGGAANEPLPVDFKEEEMGLLPLEENDKHLEVNVIVVASTPSSKSDGQRAASPPAPGPRSPEGHFSEQETCYMSERRVRRQRARVSRVHYPYFLTDEQLHPFKPKQREDPAENPGGAEKAIQGQEVATGGEQPAPAPGCPSAGSRSWQGIKNMLGRVRRVFRRSSPPPRPQPSPAPGGERGRGNVGTRLRIWFLKHRGRVHPHPC